jgi:hypothetical protein
MYLDAKSIKNEKKTTIKQSYEYHEQIPKIHNEEEYKKHLAERGEQWDKYLKDKKNKYVSKEMQIGKEIDKIIIS